MSYDVVVNDMEWGACLSQTISTRRIMIIGILILTACREISVEFYTKQNDMYLLCNVSSCIF